ncbi:MAG TPA: hypothetical protein VJU61_16115, partial [Polyangiaceae bacterium]|nr:hypothetical protein [Polyangiaceae bacterium]
RARFPVWATAGLGLCLGQFLYPAAGVGTLGAAPLPPAAEFSARLQCQRRSTPGRVLCEAELEVQSGVLRWGDVLVLEAPEFARPLRSRVGPSALFMQSERRQRLQLALAAARDGTGSLRVRARGVVCPDASGQSCRAVSHELSAPVLVGPITE